MDHASFENLPELTILLDRAQQGDKDAASTFTEVVIEKVHQLVHRARARFPGIKQLESTTADTNEVFMRLLYKQSDKKRHFESRSHFLGACFTTAHRMLIDRLREFERDRDAAQEMALVERPQPDHTAVLELDEQVQILDLALDSLPQEDFTLICLTHFLQMTKREAFRLLELPESSGRDRLKKIMVQLGAAVREKRKND